MKSGDILELKILEFLVGGRGLGSAPDGMKVFVEGGLAGQTVRAQITQKKRRYAEARMLEVIEKADYELEIPYQRIPGAPWITMPVEDQILYKRLQVQNLFSHLAGIEFPPEGITDITISPRIWNYRNKMEYSFGPTEELRGDDGTWNHTGFGLGFKKSGQYWLVESLEKPSGMFDEAFESRLKDIRIWAEGFGLPVYNNRKQTGFWRQLLVRKSFTEDKFLICLIVSEENDLIRKDFERFFREIMGDRLGGLFWQTSSSSGDAVRNYERREKIGGQETLLESINGLSFEISLESFFQTNPAAAEKLYEKVSEFVGNESGLILDLFCGTGTIGQILKSKRPERKIIGVEIIESAVKDAERNALRNKLEGLDFFVGDVGDFLKKNPEYQGKVGTVVIDPPRAGIAPKTLEKIIALGAQNLIYVSCNPSTMARDTDTLKKAGYRIDSLALVDQFPHTAHIEALGRFIKSES